MSLSPVVQMIPVRHRADHGGCGQVTFWLRSMPKPYSEPPRSTDVEYPAVRPRTARVCAACGKGWSRGSSGAMGGGPWVGE